MAIGDQRLLQDAKGSDAGIPLVEIVLVAALLLVGVFCDCVVFALVDVQAQAWMTEPLPDAHG
jgi:hypothetical protein